MPTKEEVADAVVTMRQQLIEGVITPGTQIDLPMWADRLDTTEPAVKLAIAELVTEGALVRIAFGRPAFVPTLRGDVPSRLTEIADTLADHIARGHLRNGEKLSVVDWGRRTGITRDTVRNAFLRLRERGYIDRNAEREWLVRFTAEGVANVLKDDVRFQRVAPGDPLPPSLYVRFDVERRVIDDALHILQDEGVLTAVGTIKIVDPHAVPPPTVNASIGWML